MKQRGVRQEWVEDAIRSPDQLVPGYAGRKIAQKMTQVTGSSMLPRVVHEETEDRIVVIPAYVTSGFDRYSRKDP